MEGKYHDFLEAAPDAMVVVNQAGEVVPPNVRAEEQFGCRRDKPLGQQLTITIAEGFAQRIIADDLRSMEGAISQQVGTGTELTGRRKNGSNFPIEIRLSLLADAEGIVVSTAIRNIIVAGRRKSIWRKWKVVTGGSWKRCRMQWWW